MTEAAPKSVIGASPGGPNLIQGRREGFLKDVTFNPRCGRKEVEERC